MPDKEPKRVLKQAYSHHARVKKDHFGSPGVPSGLHGGSFGDLEDPPGASRSPRDILRGIFSMFLRKK